MSLRDSMRESAAPYLQPGESVQAVIGAQTASQYMIVLTGVIFFFLVNKYRIIVATPQRILVLDAGRWSQKKAQGVVTELPRSTRLGPGTGVWHTAEIGDEKLRIHRRFFKDIQAADNELGGA